MIVKRILLATSAAALISTPAWALPSQAPSNQGTAHAPSTTPVGPPSTTPNNTENPGAAHAPSTTPVEPPSTTPNNTENPGAANRSPNGDKSGEKGAGDKGGHGSENRDHANGTSHPGRSHKCTPHSVAYIAAGMLVSQTLTKSSNGTYSGEVSVNVEHTNHHAAADKGATKTYKVENVHVTFGLADTNNDGTVGLDDVKAGDRVKLIGKITTLAKKCSQSEFTATTTIHRIVFHMPATPS